MDNIVTFPGSSERKQTAAKAENSEPVSSIAAYCGLPENIFSESFSNFLSYTAAREVHHLG
jgi:hypothetical protein